MTVPLLDIHLTDDDLTTALRTDARTGLTADPKSLPPKWFYDARGSELFERITELPDTGGKMPPVDGATRIVMLDEKGRDLPSLTFATQLGRWRDDGVRETRFLLGAADGFDDAESASSKALKALSDEMDRVGRPPRRL